MKKFLLVPLIMTALTLPGFAIDSKDSKEMAKHQTEVIQAPQSKFMDEVLSSYNDGKYRAFLKRMHENYIDANKKWEYNSMLEERKKLSAVVQDFDSSKASALKKKIAALYEAENRELADFCISEPSCVLTREVKDMVFFTPSQHEQESLQYLAGLNWKFKGDGKTPLENKLIDIDTEFWLKSLSLDLLATQNKIDNQVYKEQRTVLNLEKMKQMQLACQGQDVDPKVKDYIETAQRIYPKVQASSITRKHLYDLAVGKVQPQDATEAKLQTIVIKYHDKQQQLIKKHFPEEQN